MYKHVIKLWFQGRPPGMTSCHMAVRVLCICPWTRHTSMHPGPAPSPEAHPIQAVASAPSPPISNRARSSSAISQVTRYENTTRLSRLIKEDIILLGLIKLKNQTTRKLSNLTECPKYNHQQATATTVIRSIRE